MPAAAKASANSAGDSDPMMFAPISPSSILRLLMPRAPAGAKPAAEEQLRDARIGKNVRRGVFDAGLALLQHQPVVGDLQRLLGVLLDQQNRDAVVAQAISGWRTPPAPSAATGRSTARRSGSASDRAAARARLRASSAGRPTASRPARRAFSFSIGKRCMIVVHAVRQARLIGQAPRRRARDCGARSAPEKCCGPAECRRRRRRASGAAMKFVMSRPSKRDRAAAHRQQAENRLEHRRFAGAVRADHRGDRAAANRAVVPLRIVILP